MQKFFEIVKESKTRIITAIVLIAVVLFAVFTNSFFITWLVLGLVYMVSFHEACKLFDVKHYTLYSLALFFWIVLYWYPNPVFMTCLTILVLVATMTWTQKLEYKNLAPFFYPTLPMAFFLLCYVEFGMFGLIWMIFIISFTDIGAYLVGKMIGKTKFCLASPNKTWEGVIGGISLGTIIGILIGLNELSLQSAFIVSIATSTASVWGDLFESYLKRQANVKDSGNIFPGHGGMLDRVDGYLFGSVVMVTLLDGMI